MKPKKHFLEFEDSQDFEVLAICSHIPDYRLVWTLNKFAELELVRSEKLFPNYSKKGEFLANHVQFEFFDDFLEVEYLLIKNKNQKSVLAPELELVDYLLFISTQHNFPTDAIRQRLITSDSIIAIFKVDADQVKSLGRLEVFS